MKKIHLLFITIFLISCSNPLDKSFNQDTLEEDIKILKENISEEDINTLGAYILLKSISNDDMSGLSYGELLNEAKKNK